MSVLPPFALHRPQSVDEALGLISFDDMPLGGGTELLLAMRMRILRPETLVNLKQLEELNSIHLDGSELVIGGGVTHLGASESALVAEHLPILPKVLLEVGNPRVRASGTLAGNLVFAEPKSDVIPILLALDARVQLRSASGSRQMTIDEFIIGPYYCAREPEELLTEIRIPTEGITQAVYLKYQTMERPTVGVAALDLERDGAQLRRIVVGAVAETPSLLDFAPGEQIDGAAIAATIEPIPDIAGSARYKQHVTGVYIDRAVAALDGEST